MENSTEMIRELKEKEETDILRKTCCDILRAVTILHGSAWDSDLEGTLNELWFMKELGADQIEVLQKKIKDALKILNEKGIVTSQNRLRADLSKPYPTEENMHTAKDFVTLLREFGGDKDVIRYRREIMGYR